MSEYQVKTYCTFNTCTKHGRGCDMALTDDVKRKAQKSFGGDGFLLKIFMAPPPCFKPVED